MSKQTTHDHSAFRFLKSLDQRETQKPRKRGLTGIIDFGLPPEEQDSLLSVAADFIDLGKLSGSTPAMYSKKVLQRKISVYKNNDIEACLGGQMYEYAYSRFGDSGIRKLIDECRAVGFDSIEISDTMIAVAPEDRARHIKWSLDAGLQVIGETGSVDKLDDIDALIENVQSCIDAGAKHVIVEGMQIIEADSVRTDLLDALKTRVDVDLIFFELPWVGHEGVTHSMVEKIKTDLVFHVGVNVNMSNVPPFEAVETEGVRLEIDNPKMWL